MRYALGVTAAIIAGLAFNVGLLIQKAAVARVPAGAPLVGSLVRSPVWISGFVLQFILGTPLYTLSVGIIGPAIVPGLMSIGLVVLALGAVLIQGEHLAAREIAGIAFVMVAVALFGLSRLSIDVHAVPVTNQDLLVRSGLFSAAMIAVALGCAAGARAPGRVDESRAALHALRAGVWYTLGNLGVGFITAALVRFGAGVFVGGEIAVFCAAVALTVIGNLFGIASTQHALARGRAAVAIPLQNAVSQVLPVLVFFLVYRPYLPTPGSIAFLCGAGATVLAGAVLLAGRLAGEGDRARDQMRKVAS